MNDLTVTREAAKAAITEWLAEHVALRAGVTGRGVNWDKYEAILRLALAALEDQERIEWMEAQAEGVRGAPPERCGAPGLTEAGCECCVRRVYVPNEKGEGVTLRAAIDRARGAVSEGT